MPGKRKLGRIALSRLLAGYYPEKDSKDLYSAVLCGEIIVNGERIRDPKTPVPGDSDIEWNVAKYVGRGGFKLEGALEDLSLNPHGMVCLDAGSSTGGFTDCLLSRGAICVHAVDVGYNQLVWKLRSDERVKVYEQTNLMDLSRDHLIPPPEFAVADLSFRSLRGAAGKLLGLTGGRDVLALVKPQFEKPVEENFDGVVRSREARSAVLKSLMSDLALEGVFVHGAAASRITGRKGNAEIFLLLSGKASSDPLSVEMAVEKALDDSERRQRSLS
jgi:23S rRNA (cytidine1920-2'-O)/16S rRNA (cytidine1409-2'-O)-methyltransferase